MEDAVTLPAEPVKSVPPMPRQDTRHALDLIELEMALDSAQPALNGFAESVRQAAASLDGAFLFDLPGSGLVEKAKKIAAVHIPDGGHGSIAFVLLSEDGTTVSVTTPDEATADLARFAEAFVDLHHSLARADA